MRPVARAGVLTGSTLVAMAVSVGPLLAAAGSGTLRVVPSAEAWYRSSPTCTTPLGCAPATTKYPAGTFHVGVTLGAEDSRSYLQLDLTALPTGTKPTGGQLRLPLAPAGDGTSSPETAQMRACLAPQAVETADGTAGSQAPKIDCEAASVDAVFEPAAGNVPAAFIVDLAALASAWQSSAAPGALALLPGKAVAKSDRWHVAFNKQTRKGGGLVKPTAAVSYTGATVDTSNLPPPLVTAPVQAAPPFGTGSSSGGSLAAAVAPAISGAVPAAAGQVPSLAGRQQPVVAQPAVAPVGFTASGFRYPGVFLLPLLFALAVAWLGRAFTRDLRMS